MGLSNLIKRSNRLSILLVLLGWLALLTLPLLIVKPNRIALGDAKTFAQLIEYSAMWCVCGGLALWSGSQLFLSSQRLRLGVASVSLFILLVGVGQMANALAMGSSSIRISPAAAFWVLFSVYTLSLADGLLNLRLKPLHKLSFLILLTAFLACLLHTHTLDALAVMREYNQRQSQFWDEFIRHVNLTFGSLFIALVFGLPLGLACFVLPKIRAATLQVLSLVQTVPSLALFGLLMAPLSYLAAHYHWVAAMGVTGIGVAPALIALVFYGLLPIVANTVVGLNSVSPFVKESAKGMGLTRMQILFQIELPLALPVILTGVRIVLVQTIGLVTVAALIGAGGLGVFVFQGLGQTATDLVLLGALPTVFFAFSAAVFLDVLIEYLKKDEQK
ncbi:ABC transporter permease [Hydromonas duriensis]|uniref:Osmoprotectant transport system permease protein n=1 Tax=Hydromonas duriensis TaxID=1527608 RepID=A0A4V3DK52_9BURK|nr:ABC transporter permease [Hydromonas duriensis]TDR32797.1 osmoprotectant transport system permease protein [Hydromonas duriensis]